MGDYVWDLVGTNCSSLDFEKFDFGLSVLEFEEGEPSLDVVEEPVALVGLGKGEDVHNTNWELDVSSDPTVNFDSRLFILNNDVGFSASECDLEVVPK
jgi:hypothetical protein